MYALSYPGYKSYSYERSQPREDVCTLKLAFVCYSVAISLRQHKPGSSVIRFDCMRYASSPSEKVDDPCILDLGFVLDASSSITNAWRDVRKFVAGVTKLLNVSAEGTHVGVIKFGKDSNVEFGFNEGQDTDTVVDKVLRLPGPVPGANTQLHKGLRDADEKLYNEETNSYGYRKDPRVRKVGYLLSFILHVLYIPDLENALHCCSKAPDTR